MIAKNKMNRFLFMPDSFKGTLTSQQVCDTLTKAALKIIPDCKCKSIYVADGGEGTVDSFLSALNGEKHYVKVKGPYMETMRTYYGLINNGDTAIIEMASCAGLDIVKNHKNPLLTTTYGVGQQLLDAAEQGVKRIIIGLGGSCTNDGGCGAAAAVGIKFLNKEGVSFIPTGGTLKDIHKIDTAGLDPKLKNIEILAMCDVDNPLCGKNGAAYIFGPQKGADLTTVYELDRGLMHLSNIIWHDLGFKVASIKGAAAAGGMGAGMLTFFNAQLKKGIEIVLDTVNFEEEIKDIDIIFTGEGKIDIQSLRGKVVLGIARRAMLYNKPVIAIVGQSEDSTVSDVFKQGVTAIFPINRRAEDLSISQYISVDNLRYTAENVFRLIKTMQTKSHD